MDNRKDWMTLKEKLALAKQKDYLLNEIKHYQMAVDGRDDRFRNYHLQRIAVLEQQILELTGE